MKKFIAIILCLTMFLSLAACAGANNDSAKGSPDQPSSVEDAPASNVDSSDKKEVTLSVMVTTRPTDGDDLWADHLAQMVKEKYPHINLQIEQLPTDQYKSTVKMKFASGQGPDIFTWWPDKQAESLVEAGYVKDISDFSQLSNFHEDIVDSYVFDGKTYAVPLGMSFLTTWYNKEHFAKAGIESLPTNWTEFTDACEKLKQAGFTPITMGDKDSFVVQFGVYQTGASAIYGNDMDFDNKLYTGESNFNDPKWIDTISKYADLYNKGYVIDGSLGLSQQQSRQAFLDGQASMIFDGSFGYAALAGESSESFEKGMFCIPGNDEGEPFVYNLTPAVGLFVNSTPTDEEAVQDVLEFWFTEGTPLFDKWVEKNENINSYVGIEDSRPMVSEYLERYSDSSYIYNLNNAWPEGVSDTMCTKFQEVITGTATPEDVCQAMQDKFEQVK